MSRGTPLHLDGFNQDEGLSLLRDALATLKWEIMERYGASTREELLHGQEPDALWTDHIENYIAKQKIYEREEESHAHYMKKADIEQIQAFEHLMRLIPNKNNAFLFSKEQFGQNYH